FIRGARAHGDQLVGIVARDSVVEVRKGSKPEHSEVDRIKMLLEVPEIDLVYLGDVEEGTYKMLKEVNPFLVYLGYDQEELKEDLEKNIKAGKLTKMELVMGTPYKPEELHNSIIKKSSKDAVH
ncbi:MAG: hypothetical protein WCK91_02765, partial [bacterium]